MRNVSHVRKLTESFVTTIDRQDVHTITSRLIALEGADEPFELGGRFEVLRCIGEGGSGIVYEARRPEGDVVALKVLRSEHVGASAEMDRITDEADLLARLSHPAIVSVLESGVFGDGRAFLVMPRLEGETLANRLARGPLPMDEALAHFEILADALETLHRAGVVHRDLKPENVFLEQTPEGTRPVLLDFGIAHATDAAPPTTTVGRIRGTPLYMAPERLLGTKADRSSDIYELAVILTMMLSGRLPWLSPRNLLERLSPLPPAIATGLPSPLVAVLRRALSSTPDERPKSALSFALVTRRAGRSAGRGPRHVRRDGDGGRAPNRFRTKALSPSGRSHSRCSRVG